MKSLVQPVELRCPTYGDSISGARGAAHTLCFQGSSWRPVDAGGAQELETRKERRVLPMDYPGSFVPDNSLFGSTTGNFIRTD